MTMIHSDIPGTAALARLRTLSGLASELCDRAAAEAEHVLSVSATALMATCGLDRVLVGVCTIESGNGAPSDFVQILGYRTSTGDIEAVTDACPEIALPTAADPLTTLLDAYAAAADNVVDPDCAWRLLLTADGAVRLEWNWHDLVEHDLDLRDPAPLSEATYYAMLDGVLPAGSASLTIAGRNVRMYSAADTTSLMVTVPVGAGVQRLETLDEFHTRVGALAQEHGLGVAYAPGRRLDVLAAAMCRAVDTTAFVDRVSELTERAPSVARAVPVEMLRRAQRAMAGDSNDAEHDALADLVDDLLGGAATAPGWVTTVRLATAATPAVRDALTSTIDEELEAMATMTGARAKVRVSDDGLDVSLTVAGCALGVAQNMVREFVRFCAALRIEIAEVVSIVPAP